MNPACVCAADSLVEAMPFPTSRSVDAVQRGALESLVRAVQGFTIIGFLSACLLPTRTVILLILVSLLLPPLFSSRFFVFSRFSVLARVP